VSGFQKPETHDHIKRPKPHEWGKPRIARISYGDGMASCSCGWSKTHQRSKILEDAIDRHLAKRHEGKGLRF
jgi:hypothetical protein